MNPFSSTNNEKRQVDHTKKPDEKLQAVMKPDSIVISEENSKDQLYLELAKGIEIFTEIIGSLIKNYIVPLDPRDLFLNAIQGIVNNLDPYTYFFPSESDMDEVIFQDSYVGLGVVISVVDSSLMIVDFLTKFVKDSSDFCIGDRIIKIDSFDIPPNLDSLRKYTAGEPNTAVKVKIFRESTNDTLLITANRREFALPSLSNHFEFESDRGKILYFQIIRFDAELPNEVKKILTKFLSQNENKAGILIDLRDNPGGTLESAVSIAEMFLPPNRTIVTTKGQSPYSIKEYKSLYQPLDTILPLILIVNSGTASASEVLAGALQDNDRAIIIGEQTYGKGVIQNLIPLPYGSYLKITTAKYFTPSGRCIHRNRNLNKTTNQIDNFSHDQNVFQTLNNRQVFDTSGITPDLIISTDENPKFIEELDKHSYFTRFARFYLSKNQNENFEFNSTFQDKILQEFIKFLHYKGFVYKESEEKLIDSAITHLQKNNNSKETFNKLLKVRDSLKSDLAKICKKHKNKILDRVQTEILRQKLDFEEFKKYLLIKDKFFSKAKELLLDPQAYQKLITSGYKGFR
ncbi:MAG: S41 family peptidase [Candidatus Kapaibacteriales bacterium]